MRKLSTLVLAATAATSLTCLTSASADQAAPLCGNRKVTVSQGQCVYYPTTKTGTLTIQGIGHADVVCAGGGYSELTGTSRAEQHTPINRVVANGLVPCLLTWAGVDPFTAGAN